MPAIRSLWYNVQFKKPPILSVAVCDSLTRAVLLDVGQQDKNRAAEQYAAANGIQHVIWQRPDH